MGLPVHFGACAPKNQADFVYLTEAVPNAILEIRYFRSHRRVSGATALMTREAADSLRAVTDDVIKLGYRLKINDAYRPQCAVDHFVRWAFDVSDTTIRQYFYPDMYFKFPVQ